MNDKKTAETSEQIEFRKYCRQWLKDNPPGPEPPGTPTSADRHPTQEQMDYLQVWQTSAYKGGLVGCAAVKDMEVPRPLEQFRLTNGPAVPCLPAAFEDGIG
ncbi:MAG: hypothetical protein V3S89_06655, partial [Desulfobacterales bacterium]